MNFRGLYVQKRIIIYWHIFHSSSFHHICNIKCRLDCRYSPQNIFNFNAKNFNPHKKLISLLNVPICTQGMKQTWWPEAGTIIVTGPYSLKTKFLILRTDKIIHYCAEFIHIFMKHEISITSQFSLLNQLINCWKCKWELTQHQHYRHWCPSATVPGHQYPYHWLNTLQKNVRNIK